mmetsp:Transcript_30716/g.55726  ORF Transcript_30716/g.55726 Transcript_30716/m.55726 type:complete len:316 (-) Transcript_30716:118-1065(-)
MTTPPAELVHQAQKLISPDEVRKNCSEGSAWIVLFGYVYDVTDFVSSHPGGREVILAAAGKDATAVWSSLHKKEVLEEYLKPVWRLGSLATAEDGHSLDQHEFMKPQDSTSNESSDITFSVQEDAKVLKARMKRAQPVNVGYTMAIIDSLIQIQSGVSTHIYMERIVSVVEERGDPNCTDQDGQGGITPLGIAATVGTVEQVQRLLNAKADPQYGTERGVSILHKFAARPMPDASASATLSLLLQAQCNINAQMSNGRTPLHVAAQWGQVEMIRLLLNAGANTKIRAGLDGSAADWAQKNVLNRSKLNAILRVLK